MQLVTFQHVDLTSKHSPFQQYVRTLVPQPIVVPVDALGDQRITKLQKPYRHEQRAEARIVSQCPNIRSAGRGWPAPLAFLNGVDSRDRGRRSARYRAS